MATQKQRVLVVDDSPDTLEVLERNLSSQGYEVVTAPGVKEAVAVLERRAVEVVITDLKMPGISGLELVRHVRDNYRATGVLMITGYPSVEGAVQAVKSGAEDFLPKPFTDEELAKAVAGVFARLASTRALATGATQRPVRGGLLGDSEPMQRVGRAVERAAASEAPVLLTGETGTGKELAARTVHYSSARGGAPFVSADLAAIPAEQVLTELFGEQDDGRGGLLKAAERGTLFLSEVDRASPEVQGRLSALLEDRQAGGRARAGGARIIAASTRDLIALARQKVFSDQLLYRLHIVGIELPALRDRGDDILLLAGHFAARFAAEARRPAPRLSDRAVQVLKSYSWPGNVGELQSVMQRLAVMSGEQDVQAPDLPSLMRFSVLRDRGLSRTLEEVETEYIQSVLASVDGNRTRAAEILGIDRKTLREKMKRAGVAGA